MNELLVERALDWLAEPRLPHHLPFWAARWWRFGRRLDRSEMDGAARRTVPIALTFDIEQDLGSYGTPERWTACAPFLDWLLQTAEKREWRTTLFVQGSLVQPLGDRLRELATEHELGLHGYYHELWGRPLWFAPRDTTEEGRRDALLGLGREAFDRAGLPQPTAFRAPDLVADDRALALLDRRGFVVDSSGAAFRGCLPVPGRRHGVMRIPVSADPRPRIRRRLGIPAWARFDHLNAQAVLRSSLSELLNLCRRILTAQVTLGVPPHLVVLAHPWEFADIGAPGCALDNRERLLERLDQLNEQWGFRQVPLSVLATRLAAT
jgi:peptidoglycan/xylan/chitin deacetylase (PgdA/CDA1 family)